MAWPSNGVSSEESTRILGLGVGLFILILLWSSSLFTYLVTSRAKSQIAIIGPISVSVVSVITLLLLLIPRNGNGGRQVESPEYLFPYGEFPSEPDEEAVRSKGWMSDVMPPSPQLPPDWMYVWRTLILVINVTCLLIAITMVHIRWFGRKITRPEMSQVLQKTHVLKLD